MNNINKVAMTFLERPITCSN